jgi:hypothetical protein
LLPYWVTSRLKSHQKKMAAPTIFQTYVNQVIQVIQIVVTLDGMGIKKKGESRYCNKETFHLLATIHSFYPFQTPGPWIGLAEASSK